MLKPLTSPLIEKIKKIAGDHNCKTNLTELYAYSRDTSVFSGKPELVVRPTSIRVVSQIVQLAASEKIPVTPAGARTACTGGALAIKGGILLDMTSLNQLINFNGVDLTCKCQAGIVIASLNDQLNKKGYYLPSVPASADMATIGGYIGNSGGGMRSFRYGGIRENVLGLTVVLPDGRIIKTGGETLKRAMGYDLTRLIIGSEGTLGVVCEATLRIYPLPASKGVLAAAFPSLEDAVQASNETLKAGIITSAVELLDSKAIKAVKTYDPQVDIPEAGAALFFEVEGSKRHTELLLEDITTLCKDSNAFYTRKTTDPTKIEEIWRGRQLVGAATSAIDERLTRVYSGEDIVVPRSKLIEAIKEINKIAEKYALEIVIFGHVFDGNIHTGIVIDKSSPEETQKIHKVAQEIEDLALKLGGAPSAEHGIGLERAERLKNDPSFREMLKIKSVFDPNNIMNPGKLGFPSDILS
ncbi:MAG: FAD-binding oxidoreductase [Candidatus Hodarchaeota archaeon]